MLKRNQPALQVFRDGRWQYVFCHNAQGHGLVLTQDRRKAIHASDIAWFANHYGNDNFRSDLESEAA